MITMIQFNAVDENGRQLAESQFDLFFSPIREPRRLEQLARCWVAEIAAGDDVVYNRIAYIQVFWQSKTGKRVFNIWQAPASDEGLFYWG